MADISRTVDIIFRGVDQLSSVTTTLDRDFAAVQSRLTETSGAVDKVGSSMSAASVSVREMVNVMTLLAGSVVVKEFIDANVAIENFGRAMTLITGSTSGAGEALEYVKGISNTLGLEIGSTANAFVSLSAAANGTSLEGQGARDIFEAVSKAMALLGKSSAETQGALLAVQQIISKGTVSSEELRGQLGERLPGAFQIAARAVGVTTAELGDLLQKGQVISTEFLPAFAAELNKTFGDTTYVTTFNAELNRLINALKDLAVSGGDSGIFGALTTALVDIARGAKSTAIEIDVLSGYFSAIKTFVAGGGEDVAGFSAALSKVGIDAGIAGSQLTNANESLAETARLFRDSATAAAEFGAANESAAESSRLKRYEADAVASLTAVSDAYALLGIKSEKVNADFVGGFATIVASAESTGAEISKALQIVVPKIQNAEELERFSAAAAQAATDGKITWERWAVEVDKASEAFLKNSGYVATNAAEVKKQADEVKKAEENAVKLALELEKLASNERIKLMEFRAEINVAQIQADAEKVVAAFESINVGITSTGDVLGELFGLFSSLDNLDSSARNALFSQIEKENTLRSQSFELQKKLTEAQIANLDAQTRNLDKGDALIKIDGAGLQPHLEAFMWEILRTIQVRVNSQGLSLLLGV